MRKTKLGVASHEVLRATVWILPTVGFAARLSRVTVHVLNVHINFIQLTLFILLFYFNKFCGYLCGAVACVVLAIQALYNVLPQSKAHQL